MQVDIPTMIALGTVLTAVVGSFVRNETNQKRIIERLDRMNGSVKDLNQWRIHHIEEKHSK